MTPPEIEPDELEQRWRDVGPVLRRLLNEDTFEAMVANAEVIADSFADRRRGTGRQ